ncbi:helix-turn-helix transcriptional regulator [Streptosporangium sp. NPDC051022]|uniref:helix-turn-helix domain-containing protein n=1 Tax=Streptosporangium sp. NPDC051022 TaxID=3155752 RepID=UPI00341B3409
MTEVVAVPGPKELDPALSPSAYFGYELRKYRTAAGLSQTALASRIGYSYGLVSMTETGKRPPTDDFVNRCDEALELEGALGRLKAMIDNMATKIPPWFREWVEIEQNAESLRTWEPIIVPGLLQTPKYARAILSGRPKISPEILDKDLATRLERQKILDRDDPPMFWVVLDEGVLIRPVGDSEVMVEQLDHLLELAQHPAVAIQVLPHDARCMTGVLGAFVVAQGPGLPDTVYLESSLRGETVDDPEDVKTILMWYEAIRAESASKSSSLAIIEEKRAQWTRC